MYWGLAYGLAAAIVLMLINFLAELIGFFSFFVFLAGLIWGGYRNYLKQKRTFETGAGVTSGPQSPVQEFKQAVGDIAEASQELFQQEQQIPGEQPAAPQEPTYEEPPQAPQPPQQQPPSAPQG